MHFYQFNIADYRKDTWHLTPIEHYIYRELLDICYLNEIPINGGLLSIRRRLKLTETDDLLIEGILDEFFIKTDDGYINNRVNLELSRIYDKSDKARESVKKRWDKANVYERNTNVYERNTNAILPNTSIPNTSIPNTQNISTNVDILAKPKKHTTEKLLLMDFGIDEDLADDFVKLRKAKRAPITKTVCKQLQNEATKAGIAINQAVEICISRTWQNFNASWDWKNTKPINGTTYKTREQLRQEGTDKAREAFLASFKTIDSEVVK